MNRKLISSILLSGLAAAGASQAELTVASVFSDHAVLQRAMEVPVWGTADPGAKVAVAFQGQSATASAGKNGQWRLKLKPLKEAGPASMTVSGTGGESITLNDILVGEVWVGSGQSNMAGGAGGYAKRDATLAKLVEGAPYPKIRLLKGGPKPTWVEATPQTVPGFSAILFAFGERLHRDLDVPVGLILGAVGGTPSGSWLSQDAFNRSEACQAVVAKAKQGFDEEGIRKAYEAKLAAWEKQAAAAKTEGKKPKGRKPAPSRKPGESTRGAIGNLYEKFIRSVVGYGIRGVLWDQGESGTAVVDVDQYSMMGALINGWRHEWGQGEFPFIYIQKPSGGGPAFDQANPLTREANSYAVPPATVPNVTDGARRLEFIRIMDYPKAHMVPACDLGSGVHPINKWGYGNRAGEVALSTVYGKDLLAHGPRYKSHTVEGRAIRIKFDNVGAGLTSKYGDGLTGFAIAGKDQKFHWALAMIDGDSVLVSSEQVAEPVAVRFACAKNRAWANLFNENGLPGLAFRTDEW
jgi:sialate O-acetylesterase